MKTQFKRWLTWSAMMTIPLLATPVILALNQSQNNSVEIEENQGPQIWNPPLDPQLSFQANIDKLIANNKLTMRWQNQVQAPIDLIKIYLSDHNELTKGFEFWAWRDDLATWTNDIGWSWQISDATLKDKQLVINWEILETDEKGYPTGQYAKYKQSFDLQDQPLTISQYQDQILTYQLENWKTSRDYRQLSTKQWINLMANQKWFFATVMQPLRILGKAVQPQISQQVVEKSLTINVDQVVKKWDFLQAQNMILFTDDLRLLSGRNTYDLIVVNDGTKRQLHLNDNWDGQRFNVLNLSGWQDVVIGQNFVFRAEQIQFAKQAKLVVPEQNNSDPGLVSAILPQADLVTTNKWLRYFQINDLNYGGYVKQAWAQLEEQWFNESAPNTLDWSQFLGPDQYRIDWAHFLKTVVMKRSWNRIILNATNVELWFTNIFQLDPQAGLIWNERLQAVQEVIIPSDQIIPKLNLTKLMQALPNATIKIGTNVQLVEAPVFDAQIDFQGKIERQINPQVIKHFVQGQKLVLKGDDGYQINRLLNTYNLEQNQQLYGNIKTVVWEQFSYGGIENNNDLTYISASLWKKLAFLIKLPSWQVDYRWEDQNHLVRPLKQAQAAKQVIDVQLKPAAGVLYNWVNDQQNEWVLAPEQIKWLAQYGLTYQFIGPKKTNLIDDQGVLDYQKYIQAITTNPSDENNYLNDQGQYIKAIKLAPDQKIIADRSLMGLNFKTPLTLDLSQIETIGDHAFSATQNLKLINGQKVKNVGVGAFSGIGAGLTIDLTKVQWDQISDDCFRGTTLKLINDQIGGQIKTINKGAFLATDLDYQNSNQPLDLSPITTIGFNAFSYNENLNYVQTGANYITFNGFENSGLKGFDFQAIERINFLWTPDHSFAYQPSVRFALPNFSQSELNLANFWSWNDPHDYNDLGIDFNLPSVKKLIWNAKITKVKPFSIKGLVNLEQLVNYQGTTDPNSFFQALKQPLKLENAPVIDPASFGYDLKTGIVDWSEFDLMVNGDFWSSESSDQSVQMGALVVTKWNQLINYFQQHQIGVVNKMILPKIFFSTNVRFHKLWAPVIKPLFKIKELAISNRIAYQPYDPTESVFQVFQPFIIDRISSDFFINIISDPLVIGLWNWNLQKQDQAILLNPTMTQLIGYGFKNSGIKAIKWNNVANINTVPNLQLGPDLFDQGIEINLHSKTRIAINTFSANEDWRGVQIDGKPVWEWLKGLYQPDAKLLDLRQTPEALAQWLVVIFQNVALKTIFLPPLKSLKTDWFKIGKSVEKIVISDQSEIVGADAKQLRKSWKQNLSQIKTIISNNIVVDHLGIIKN